MSNIKLKNASGTETTYSGVTSVKIPLASGSGNAVYAEGISWLILFHETDMAGGTETNYSITCDSTSITKTRSELITYAKTVNKHVGGSNIEIITLGSADLYTLFNINVLSQEYTFTVSVLNVGGDREFRYFNTSYTQSSFVQVTSNTTFSATIGKYDSAMDGKGLIILTNFYD